MKVKVSLQHKDRKVLRLKVGEHSFTVLLVDLPNEFVEVYKCVANSCSPVTFDVTDQYGRIEFEDRIEGLSTVIYRFIHSNEVFAELHVIPILIDANEVLSKVSNLLETLLIARRLGAG